MNTALAAALPHWAGCKHRRLNPSELCGASIGATWQDADMCVLTLGCSQTCDLCTSRNSEACVLSSRVPQHEWDTDTKWDIWNRHHRFKEKFLSTPEPGEGAGVGASKSRWNERSYFIAHVGPRFWKNSQVLTQSVSFRIRVINVSRMWVEAFKSCVSSNVMGNNWSFIILKLFTSQIQ